MGKRRLDRRIFLAVVLIAVSFFVFIYQLKFSESARLEANLKDLSRMEYFSGDKVDQEEILSLEKGLESHSFTLISGEELDRPRELGEVKMFDKEDKEINSLILFQEDKDYLLYMRGLYMLVD